MFDLTNLTAHVITEREKRFQFIQDTIGFGEPCFTCKKARDKDGDAIATLTDTGVIVIQEEVTETIITAYIATVKQAYALYYTAKGTTKMPSDLWKQINYNNNTDWYRRYTRS